MEYLIFIPAMSWVVIEAWYDSIFGDRHIVPVAFFHILFCFVLAAVLPHNTWWQGIAAFIATRIWFDYVYNAFAGVWWGYMGQTAMTDKLLRNFDAYSLFVVRVLIFVGSLILFNTSA